MKTLPEELLNLASRLATLDGVNTDQATLRRAVSTSYYALFHLLISEATLNWGRSEHRSQIGRLFEHGGMRKASEKVRSDFNKLAKKQTLLTNGPSEVDRELVEVAEVFLTVQQARIEADYVTGSTWTYP